MRNLAAWASGVVVLGLAAGMAGAEEQREGFDPEAMEVVKAWSSYVKGLDAFQQTVETSMKMQAEGMLNETTSRYAMALDRPDRFAFVLTYGINGVTLVSDGESLHTYMKMMKRYTEEKAPESLEELASNPVLSMGGGRGLSPAPFFLAANPAASILEGVTSAAYVGEEQRDGAAVHHLRFTQAQFDWDGWFTVSDQPVLVEIVPDMTKSFAAMGKTMPGFMQEMKVEHKVVFSDWKEEVEDPDLFTFTAPEGASEEDSLFGGMGGPDRDVKKDLVGTEAKPVKLDLLGGGKMDLAAHKGEKVVILDFWATWCAPCVRAMPSIVKVAEAFADRGVVFYAVNQRETPDVIKRFLKRQDLNLTVALDPQGRAGRAYQASAIPQTVIIDKDGMIADVHVGASPDLEEELTEVLEALVGEGEASP
jgi:peroxiredoxin